MEAQHRIESNYRNTERRALDRTWNSSGIAANLWVNENPESLENTKSLTCFSCMYKDSEYRDTVPAQCVYHHKDNLVEDRGRLTAAIGLLKGCKPRKQWLVRKKSRREDQNGHRNQQIGDQCHPIAWKNDHSVMDPK